MDFSIISEPPLPQHQAPQVLNFIFAENGSCHEYPLSKFVNPVSIKEPSALMDFIEKEFGIPCMDQVILRGLDGKQLELSMDLREFFEKDHVFHVFDKRFYREDEISDDFEVICPVSPNRTDWSELKLESLPELYETFLNPELKVYVDEPLWEKVEEMITMFCDVKNEINSLRDGSIKLKRQKESESVVKKNLMSYYTEKKKKFDETFYFLKAKIVGFEELFQNFEGHLDKLSKVEIDPNLGEKDKKYLIDYFDVARAKSNKIIYEKNQGKIMSKCEEIEKKILEYDGHLRMMEESMPDFYFKIYDLIQNQEALLEEIHDKSLQRIRQLLKNKNNLFFKNNLTNFLNEEWENNMQELQEIFQDLQEIRNELETYLKDNASKLKNFVSDVANLQLVIREKLHNKHTVFRSLVEKHDKDIFALKAIAEFPSVYQASLEEIKRRHQAKKDCLTILNILETFIISENKIREDFMAKYSAYIPKSFCTMLTKSFPHFNFDYLYKLANEDGTFLLNEISLNSSRVDDSGQIIKLLKTLNATMENKEAKIQELQDMLRCQKEELNKFKEQYNKARNLSICDLNEIFGKSQCQEQLNSMMSELKQKCQQKIEDLNKKLEDIQTERVQPFEATMKEIIDEVKNEFPDTDVKNVANRLREFMNRCQESIQDLNKQLEEKVIEKGEVINRLQRMEGHVEKLVLSKAEVEKEEAALREKIETLNKKVSEMEESEKGLKVKVSELQKNVSLDQITITFMGRDLNEKEKEVEALGVEIENLTNLYSDAVRELKQKDEALNEYRGQIESLWQTLAEKDNQINDIHDILKKIEDEMQSIAEQNEQMEQIMARKDEVLKEMQEKLNMEQMRLYELESKLEEKEMELEEIEENLGFCQEELSILRNQKAHFENAFNAVKVENEYLVQQQNTLIWMAQNKGEDLENLEVAKKDLEDSLKTKSEQLERLREEKEVLLREFEDLQDEKIRLCKQVRENVTQEFSQNMKRLEDNLKAKDREIELLREIILKNLPCEVPCYLNENFGRQEEEEEEEKVDLKEKIREDVTKEFSKNMMRMEENLKAKDREIELLQNIILKNVPSEDLKNNQVNESNKRNKEEMIQEVKKMTECDCPQVALSHNLLGDFGEAILSLCTTLLGQYASKKIYNKGVDIGDLINEIPDLIKNVMVKIQDLSQGDKVLGIKIPGSDNVYQLLYNDAFNFNVLCVYEAREDLGETITGVVESLTYSEEYQYNDKLLNGQIITGVLRVKLSNVESTGLLLKFD